MAAQHRDELLFDSGNPNDETHLVVLQGLPGERATHGMVRGTTPATLTAAGLVYQHSQFTQRDEQGTLVHVYIPAGPPRSRYR